MNKFLVVVGLQPEKIAEIRCGEKLVKWVLNHQSEYTATIAIVRKDLCRDNFNRMGDTIGNKEASNLPYPADTIMEVPGYDVDCNVFRRDAEYHIMGISTGASVICTAMSMFSAGINIKILGDLCADRKGMHDHAIKIMKAYMPIAF